MVGSPEEVAEKIRFEHELFGHQGFMVQISVGTMAHETYGPRLEWHSVLLGGFLQTLIHRLEMMLLNAV
ncbi:MAG TPA: hypothetical protein VNA27_04905 [Rubrobacteraceae bacterium]|nr:hypothetical protein [Rubrobacteraceae bacterium]